MTVFIFIISKIFLNFQYHFYLDYFCDAIVDYFHDFKPCLIELAINKLALN